MLIRICLLFFWLAVLSRPAEAYIDPGSGGFLLQAVVAAIAAGFFGFRRYLNRCLAFIKRIFTKKMH